MNSTSHDGTITHGTLLRILGWTGTLFLLVAGADVLLTWLPTDFGNREWEFGTITSSLNGMLSVTFGMILVMVGLSEAEAAWPLRVVAGGFVFLAVFIVAATLLYWTNVPLALKSVQPGPISVGLTKAVIKTSVQCVAFPVAYVLFARTAWRWAKKKDA
ncbi:MAG: hypothetical protein OEZ65_09530 [Gemmatimonadota bacterium]|nr:hypothetical protein [Gemmatimonadota bacterium]MDH5759816.1 hypothetical protein [Gemmatimonadota bacterium]